MDSYAFVFVWLCGFLMVDFVGSPPNLLEIRIKGFSEKPDALGNWLTSTSMRFSYYSFPTLLFEEFRALVRLLLWLFRDYVSTCFWVGVVVANLFCNDSIWSCNNCSGSAEYWAGLSLRAIVLSFGFSNLVGLLFICGGYSGSTGGIALRLSVGERNGRA